MRIRIRIRIRNPDIFSKLSTKPFMSSKTNVTACINCSDFIHKVCRRIGQNTMVSTASGFGVTIMMLAARFAPVKNPLPSNMLEGLFHETNFFYDCPFVKICTFRLCSNGLTNFYLPCRLQLISSKRKFFFCFTNSENPSSNSL
jgi:hypothetical protein